MPNEATIQVQATARLIEKLKSLGYNLLPEQVSEDRLRFQSHQGKSLEVVLRLLDLDQARSVSLNQREFDYALPADLWIFLILTISNMEPMLLLIPGTVFVTPSNIFINNVQPTALRHFSTWEIKVFTRAIPELSSYALDTVSSL